MITQRQLEDVRRFLLPLLSEDYVKAAWVSGYDESSSALKTNILIDDTLNSEAARNARSIMAGLSANAMGITFMPLRKLSKFLGLLKHGDQLALSTLSNVILLHDHSGYIKMLNGLMRKGKIYSISEKPAKLLEKAKEKLNAANSIVYNEIPTEAYQAMAESAQSALLHAGKPSGKGIENDLAKCYGNWLEQKQINSLKNAQVIFERIIKEPKAFTSEDVEKLVGSSRDFVKHIQEISYSMETENDEKSIDEAYRHCMKKISEINNAPHNDFVNSLKKLVDIGHVSKHHTDTILRLHEYANARHKEKLALSKSKFLSKGHLHGLKIALDEIN